MNKLIPLALVATVSYITGCSGFKRFAVTVENNTDSMIEKVEISIEQKKFRFSMGAIGPGISKGYMNLAITKKSSKIRVEWRVDEVKHSVEATISKKINELIRGNDENLILKIEDNNKIRVSLEIDNPREMGKPFIYDQENED